MVRVYLERYAYLCEVGSDADRCFERGLVAAAGAAPGAGAGAASAASAAFVDRKAAKRMSRTTLAATAAALRVTAGAPGQLAGLPLLVGVATGVSASAPMLEALLAAEVEPAQIVPALFSGHGGNVLEYLKYSVNMVAGTIAEYTGLRAGNATYNGASAGYLALRAAARLLRSGRAAAAVVVSAESLLERGLTPPAATPAPRELAGALWLTAERPAAGGWALELEDGPRGHAPRGSAPRAPAPRAQAPRVDHLEAAGSMLNLCWAMETGAARGGCGFRERDFWQRELCYGVEALVSDGSEARAGREGRDGREPRQVVS